MRYDRKIFFDAIRPLFGGKLKAGQVEGMDVLLDVWEARYGRFTTASLAYCMATSYLETARTMQPVRETLASDDATAIRRLDAAYRQGRMPYVRSPYWRRDRNKLAWFGRGHVQLTHERNYRKAASKLGQPLGSKPELALDPEVSARILFSGCIDGWFTACKLSQFINKKRCDFYGARRVVNPADKKSYGLIEGYAIRFNDALTLAENGTGQPSGSNGATAAKVGGSIAIGTGAVVAAQTGLWPEALSILAGVVFCCLCLMAWKKTRH